MSERERDKVSPLRVPGAYGSNGQLPYCIELWSADQMDAVERILARVADPQLARAIFEAAQAEHPGRRITLRKGTELLADTAR
jgi:hypothetical protein